MKADIMKIEGLILALSFILLIGIANAQTPRNCITIYPGNTLTIYPSNVAIIPPGYINELNNLTYPVNCIINLSSNSHYYFAPKLISNQTATCNLNALTINTDANVMTCNIKDIPTGYIGFIGTLGYPGLLKASNISFGRPLFFIYNLSKNTNKSYYKELNLILPNSKSINFPANSSLIIAVYPNGSIFENNNLLYKFSKPQGEIGNYFFTIGPFSTYMYQIVASINQPTLNISSLPNNNIVIGYEHGFDNLTATETDNIDMIEVTGTLGIFANSTSPLIYNVYNFVPIAYKILLGAKYPVDYLSQPFANQTNPVSMPLGVNDENISTLFKSISINLYQPYFWTNNSKPVFVSNVVGSKVLEINFTNFNTSFIFSSANFNITFENKTIETLNFETFGNISLSMATNPNETEIIDGSLIYKYGNETYYYNFTNLSLTQGQLKRIVIPIVPVVTTTSAKCNIELCILLILIIIILIIIIAWRIKKHLEKKNRKVK